jgi:hypothetical protein
MMMIIVAIFMCPKNNAGGGGVRPVEFTHPHSQLLLVFFRKHATLLLLLWLASVVNLLAL